MKSQKIIKCPTKTILLNPEKELIRIIVKLRNRNYTLQEIADKLNLNKKYNKRVWTTNNVYVIYSNHVGKDNLKKQIAKDKAKKDKLADKVYEMYYKYNMDFQLIGEQLNLEIKDVYYFFRKKDNENKNTKTEYHNKLFKEVIHLREKSNLLFKTIAIMFNEKKYTTLTARKEWTASSVRVLYNTARKNKQFEFQNQ